MHPGALPLCLLALLCACVTPGRTPVEPREWAIAVHGGAGTISKDVSDEERRAYEAALEAALRLGADALERGASALEVVEQVVRQLEDEPRFNAGRGAVFTARGEHELDAAIMDGRTLACGAVSGVTTVRHPVSLARLVMERTPHVFLAFAGAEEFADEMRVERVENAWFSTPRRREQLERKLQQQAEERERGTVGCVALDRRGHLAAATSTGGMTGKRFGRVGDTPVIGAGTYADDRTCAVSCTGTGEEFIRHAVAHDVSARMLHGGASLEQAARAVVRDVLREDVGGLIAVSRVGELQLVFNTPGMFRGAADSTGRFDVAIWER